MSGISARAAQSKPILIIISVKNTPQKMYIYAQIIPIQVVQAVVLTSILIILLAVILVLQIAVGHIEGSSLPVGGEGTHCVISGHRGLPSAKLFTNLDKLAEGDYFTLTVMDNIITYEVDQILIVLPEETSDLMIVDGKDYCTLMTCTPYGINTHRLLVRGVRTDNIDNSSGKITSDAMQIEPGIVASAIAIPTLLLILIYVIWDFRRKRNYRG